MFRGRAMSGNPVTTSECRARARSGSVRADRWVLPRRRCPIGRRHIHSSCPASGLRTQRPLRQERRRCAIRLDTATGCPAPALQDMRPSCRHPHAWTACNPSIEDLRSAHRRDRGLRSTRGGPRRSGSEPASPDGCTRSSCGPSPRGRRPRASGASGPLPVLGTRHCRCRPCNRGTGLIPEARS